MSSGCPVRHGWRPRATSRKSLLDSGTAWYRSPAGIRHSGIIEHSRRAQHPTRSDVDAQSCSLHPSCLDVTHYQSIAALCSRICTSLERERRFLRFNFCFWSLSSAIVSPFSEVRNRHLHKIQDHPPAAAYFCIPRKVLCVSPEISAFPRKSYAFPRKFLRSPGSPMHSPRNLRVPPKVLSVPLEIYVFPESPMHFPQKFMRSPKVPCIPPEISAFPGKSYAFPRKFMRSPESPMRSPRNLYIPPKVLYVLPENRRVWGSFRTARRQKYSICC